MNNITEAEAHARDEAWDRAHPAQPPRPAVRYMTIIPRDEWEATKRQLVTALEALKVRTVERDVAQAEAATLERLRDHAIEELKLCRNWRPQ
jgi:hypothetical protein